MRTPKLDLQQLHCNIKALPGKYLWDKLTQRARDAGDDQDISSVQTAWWSYLKIGGGAFIFCSKYALVFCFVVVPLKSTDGFEYLG